MSTSKAIRPTPRCCSTRPSRAAGSTRSLRSARSGAHALALAHRDPRPSHDRRIQRADRGLNLLVKKVKRAGHGFRSFANYRLRILLHTGGVNWPAQRPQGTSDPNPLSPLGCV